MQTFERANEIIKLFSLEKTKLNLSEIVELTDLPKSSAYRICESLVSLGYLKKDDDKNYSLGLRFLELGSIVLSTLKIREIAMEEISKLHDLTNESIHLGVRDGTEVISIEGLESNHSLRTKIWIGKRAPLYCTAVGKAILAFLPKAEREQLLRKINFKKYTNNTLIEFDSLLEEIKKIRENGYAIDNMEHEEDVKCIGAPIFDIQNSVVASISLSGPSSRITKEKENEFAILVKSSALNISKKLAASSPVIGE